MTSATSSATSCRRSPCMTARDSSGVSHWKISASSATSTDSAIARLLGSWNAAPLALLENSRIRWRHTSVSMATLFRRDAARVVRWVATMTPTFRSRTTGRPGGTPLGAQLAESHGPGCESARASSRRAHIAHRHDCGLCLAGDLPAPARPGCPVTFASTASPSVPVTHRTPRGRGRRPLRPAPLGPSRRWRPTIDKLDRGPPPDLRHPRPHGVDCRIGPAPAADAGARCIGSSASSTA